MSRCCLSMLLLTLLLMGGAVSATSRLWDFSLLDYRDHVCARPCENYTTARLCHYDFLVENYYVLSKACYNCPYNQSDCLRPQCVSAGGLARLIKTVNRILPGPAIQVCEGDTIEVKVTNMLESGEGTTIHWHGFLQHNTAHMDGTPMVTQCPILMGSHFTYRFQAVDVGTYFWHSHAGTQRADGVFGALIVRQAADREPHRHLYDFDLPEHVMIVNDWLTVDTADRLAELVHIRENLNETILINGMGQFQQFINNETNATLFTPRANFTVTPGFRYRFRVINSGVLNCPLELRIDNHTLTVIASDGSPVEPVSRSSFTIHAGERYDFVLAAQMSSAPRNYWIRVRGLQSCALSNVSQTAILRYQGAGDQLPPEALTWDSFASYTETQGIVEQLVSLTAADDIVLAKPDKKIFLHVDMIKINNQRAYSPPLYTLASSALFESPQINGITSLLPPAPPLTQLDDLPEMEDGSPLEELQRLDSLGQLNRSIGRAPLKDTVAAPIGGYMILRFRADNPGFWLFHCHLEFHVETGMMLIFQVGNSTQLPRRPKNFPMCGSWDFQGYEDATSSGAAVDNACPQCNVTCNVISGMARGLASRDTCSVKTVLVLAVTLAWLLPVWSGYW